MVDAQGNELPTVFGQPIQPWINLVHVIGMPWVIIGLSVWYGIPFARDIAEKAGKVEAQQAETNKRMDALDTHATKAMPLLEESVKAIPLLQSIAKTTKEGSAQRHRDLDGLKTELQTAAPQ